MKNKHRSRLVEWGKNLLILLLALSLVYLLGRTQLSSRIINGVQNLLDGSFEGSTDSMLDQSSSVKIQPMRLAIYQDGRRYGVQYDQKEVDADFSALSILLAEALSSAGTPEQVSEQTWRSSLCRTGIYMDFYYPVRLVTLSGWLGVDQGNSALEGSVRRMCLAENEDGGVSLFYINEESGSYYSSETTLSSDVHLDTAVADWSPNGAQFAFEVPGMESIEPYTLLTVTPQPLVYTTGNPLLEDNARVGELLSALTFHSQGTQLNPTTGGQLVEGNDSLRLSEDGLVTFHTIGDSEFRFSLSENSVEAALDYVQSLAESTVGAWCGQARLCLAEVNESPEQIEIIFQYCLNGAPVVLSEGQAAARFIVSNGAITDFSLYLRSYTDKGETALVLPALQAAAAMEALDVYGKELTLVYQDSGGEEVSAGWIAM